MDVSNCVSISKDIPAWLIEMVGLNYVDRMNIRHFRNINHRNAMRESISLIEIENE